jgi:outer membrane protein assembly factor BamC
MKIIAILLLALQITGCSWMFGDNFRDRSDDYLKAESVEEIKLPEGMQAVSFQDQLQIPTIGDKSIPTEFVVPKAPRILVGKEHQRITLYSEMNQPKYTAEIIESPEERTFIHVSAPLDVTWSLVTQALEKTKFSVTDLDRSTGVFYIDVREGVKPEEDCLIFGIWCSDLPLPKNLRITLIEISDGVRIGLSEDPLSTVDIELQILNKVFQHLPL